MSQELPDGVELTTAMEIIRTAANDCNAAGNWQAANELLDALAVVRRLADREKQAARVPDGCPTCKRTDGYVCDWCPSISAPTEPSKPEQAEGVSDDELNELARQHTWFNGSHAMTNYPAFARAAIARWGATTPPASAAGEPEAWDAQRAYHEGRAAYEASVGHFREGKHKLFWELTSIQQAEFVARAALASKPVAPPEREAPSIGQIIEVAESWQRGFMCPLCGHDQPHEHSPREITIYRNGVKWGLKNGTEQWPWKGYPSPSKNAGHDSKGVGRQGGHGTDQHHEHRVGQSGSDRAHDQSTGRRDGIHGACDVSAKVDATPPASAAVERELPPLPERNRRFFCSKCGSTTCKLGQEYRAHPECSDCGYCGFAEDADFTAEQMQAYARAALSSSPAPVQEVELIDYEAAHRIAFQAAAAFRPSYFGEGFRAHNWVVEAVRSAHMDGQLLAHGRPPIDRAGEMRDRPARSTGEKKA